VPVKDRTRGETEALLITEIVPTAEPGAEGSNAIVTLWPGVNVAGRINAVRLNAVPLSVIWEIVTVPVPVLVRAIVWTLFADTPTLPKYPTLLALGVRW